jgi:Ca2+-binding EF-hand superfamily protein
VIPDRSVVNVMFEHFDEMKIGKLDYQVFAVPYAILQKGNLEDQLKLAFKIFDRDRNGFLDQVKAYPTCS